MDSRISFGLYGVVDLPLREPEGGVAYTTRDRPLLHKDSGEEGPRRAGTRARQAGALWNMPLARARYPHVSDHPLRCPFLFFAHHIPSSLIISPLRALFLLFVHDFSTSVIISRPPKLHPRSRRSGFGRVVLLHVNQI